MKIARLNMDAQDKTRFEIHGKSSVKYHLKANHVVEAKRWFWSLNNAIQWAKDEAKEEARQRSQNAEVLRQAKMEQSSVSGTPSESGLSHKPSTKGLAPPSLGMPGSSSNARLSTHTSRTTLEVTPEDEAGSAYGSLDAPNEVNRTISHITTAPDMDGDDDEYGDYASSREMPSEDKDALNITAQSAKLQLDLLANVSASLQGERSRNPDMTISDPAIEQALGAYEGAVSSLKGLVQNLLKISRDRDAYWQYRLNREEHLRQMWEESMARVAQEHEDLQSKMGESEEKRKRTKRALKEALENATGGSREISGRSSRMPADILDEEGQAEEIESGADQPSELARPVVTRNKSGARSTYSEISSLYDSESGDDEFFDAIDAGEIEVEDVTKVEPQEKEEPEDESSQARNDKMAVIKPSFRGYEEPPRTKLKMDNDNRPKISLWVSIFLP
jgi:sRNA-binding protein